MRESGWFGGTRFQVVGGCVVVCGGEGGGSGGGRVAESHLGVRCKQTLTNGRLTGTSLKYLPQS